MIQKQITAANTNVYRCWDDLEKTIMMMGPGTFTLQDRDDFDIEHLTGKEVYRASQFIDLEELKYNINRYIELYA